MFICHTNTSVLHPGIFKFTTSELKVKFGRADENDLIFVELGQGVILTYYTI